MPIYENCVHARFVCVCVVFAVLLLCIEEFSRVYQTQLTESSSKGRSLRTTSESHLVYVWTHITMAHGNQEPSENRSLTAKTSFDRYGYRNPG